MCTFVFGATDFSVPLRNEAHFNLEDELVRVAEFGRVLLEPLVLLDLFVVGSVEQQLLDVSGLQAVRGHVHQNLAELFGGQLQVGDQDGCV